MNFLQAWDIEKVAGQASKLVEQLDEYPTEHRPRTQGPHAGRVLSSHQSSAAFKAWDELDFEGRKQEWAELCDHVKGLDKAGKTSAEQWQHRAKDAEYHVLRLCNMLLGLPDPLPYLANTAALSTKMAEVEARNRELQAAADAAVADTTEVSTLVEQHRALVEQHQQLEDKMAASEAELVQARAAAAEAASVRAEAEVQAAEVQRLQETLRGLRQEYERAQSSLFEIANNQDQVVGSRQREMELASEELERTQQRAAELTLERDTLLQRLEAAQEEIESLMRTSVEEGHDAHRSHDGQQQQQPQPRIGRKKSLRGDGVDEEGFWERQVRVRGEQVAALQAQLAQQQQAINEGVAQLEAQAQAWSNRVAAAELSISKLEAELAKRPAPHVYQELISQVTALQQLVDVQMEAEGWGQESIREAIATLGLTPSTTSQTLSSIQQERNRKLASDVSSLKRQLEAQGVNLAAAQRDVSVMEARANAAIALADRLEGDLAAVRHGKPSHKLPGNGSQHSSQHLAGGANADGLLSESAAQHALRESIAHLPGGSLGSARESKDSSSLGSQQQQQQGVTASAALAVQGPATPDSSDPSSTSSLLDIVISQRDRFRQRMGQLEEEKGMLSEQLAHAQKQLDSCRVDNISLYEKVRFIEQYSQQKGGGGGKGGGPGGGKLQVVRVDGAGVPLESEASAEQRAGARYQCGPLAFEIGGGADSGGSGTDGGRGTTGSVGGLSSGGVRARAAGPRKVQAFCFPADDTQADEEAGGAEARYARAYEARVNPFTDFQKSEMESRVRSLQLHDRAMLAGSKLIAGNRFARAFVATYAVLLHLFIMALLYFAMLPNKHTVEMVDMSAVAQQQEAAGQGGKVGRRLLRGLFDRALARYFSHGSSAGLSARHNLHFADQGHE